MENIQGSLKSLSKENLEKGKRRILKVRANMTVEIKPIPGMDGYFGSSDGKIYSNKKYGELRELKQCKERKDGYYRVCGKFVHRLILLAFHGYPKPEQIGCHGKNGKGDNCIDNLYWGTHSQNLGKDKWRDGTILIGEKSQRGVLNECQVRVIRAAEGMLGSTKLARFLGINKSSVLRIWRRKNWGWL